MKPERGFRDRSRGRSCPPPAAGRHRPPSTRRRGRWSRARAFWPPRIIDIAAEARWSTASFHNYYDSKEAMVREWAVRFRDEARGTAAGRRRTRPHRTAERCVRGRRRALEHLPPPARRDHQRCLSWRPSATISREYWADICALLIALVTKMVQQAQRQGCCAGAMTRT